MPKRLCLEPRCGEVSTYRGRCQRHQRERNRDTHRNRHVYNSARWQNTRQKQLFLEPLCQHQGCMEIATDVDHIRPIEQGGDEWSLDNLQSLCARHHGQKTRAEQQGAKEWRPTP